MKAVTGDLLLYNGRAALPGRVLEDARIIIRDGRIEDVTGRAGRPARAGQALDACGGCILPGFIDLHSDAIEKEIEPRPRAVFPAELAFRELEKKAAGHGITTMFHSFSFANAEFGLRSTETAAEIIRTITNPANRSQLIRNRIHLRYEIAGVRAVPAIRRLVEEDRVDLLSFMDHTPGQGQFKTLESYRHYLQKTYHLGLENIEEILASKQLPEGLRDENLLGLAALAARRGLPLASHDDDSPEQVRRYHELGVRICEFPVSIEAALEAKKMGMHVCVGAPNVLRGGSQSDNVRAMDVVRSGAADILCSDYYPAAILHAVFQVAAELGDLPAAVNMATLNPARAAGVAGELGSLEAGKAADLVVVQDCGGLPAVVAAVVAGRLVYRVEYGRRERREKERPGQRGRGSRPGCAGGGGR